MDKKQRKELNGLLHEILKLRDGRCLKCGSLKYQMSHIYPKGRYRGMEFDPDNVKALCFSCHIMWWHKNPIEAGEWMKETFSKKRLDRLKLMSNTYVGKIDFKLYKLFLEKEIKKLERFVKR